jgi:molybdopterin-guanine dinucleotide biosynthesis protein A
MTHNNSILGIILAGGLARRMGGGDKCLLPLGGRTLLERAIQKAQPQVDELLLNANGNHLRFTRSGLTVLSDEYPNFPGPLAGIHAGLEWATHHRPSTQWLASFASDTPFFPATLVQALEKHALDTDAELAVASSGDRLHPVFALWHRSLLPALREALDSGETPRLQEWIKTRRWVEVPYPVRGYDPFFNINQPQDLHNAEAFLPLAD